MSRPNGPEATIEQHLRQQIEGAGGVCLKFKSTRAGVPDRIVAINGHTVFVELKAPQTGRLSKLQEYYIKRLRRSGADVRVIDSIPDVDALITELLAA